MSRETMGAVLTRRMPRSGPSAVSVKAALISSGVTGRRSSRVRSVSDPSSAGALDGDAVQGPGQGGDDEADGAAGREWVDGRWDQTSQLWSRTIGSCAQALPSPQVLPAEATARATSTAA